MRYYSYLEKPLPAGTRREMQARKVDVVTLRVVEVFIVFGSATF